MAEYLGMDVHSKDTVYLGQEPSGDVTAEGKASTTVKGICGLVKALNLPKGTKIGLEAGPQAMWVARLLSGLGMQPVVIDAREVRQKARRIGQKCDRRDAFEICDGLRRGVYTSIVYVPGPEIQRLRQILSERRYFVRVCTSQVNRAKSALRSVGLGQEAKTLTTLEAWQKLLRRPAVTWVRETLARHRDVWRVAREKVVALEGELREALKPFEETVRRLQTTPGVGMITAATYLAVIATPQRFADSGRVVSYIGLVPSTYDTGLVQRHGHITKRGSCELRAMLCEAAHSAARPTHPLNPYWVRVCAKQGYKRAVVAVAQRLGRILYAMWRKEEDFDATKLNVIEKQHTRTRTYYWQIKKPEQPLVVIG